MATYYTEEHEWVLVDGDVATLGITQFAATQLGEIVFVEQKDVGEEFKKGDEMGVIESVKAASELFAPVDCELIELNAALADGPSLLNENPEVDGWIYKIRLSNKSQLEQLMDLDAYKALTD